MKIRGAATGAMANAVVAATVDNPIAGVKREPAIAADSPRPLLPRPRLIRADLSAS
jgi:hypothetical protein